MKLYEEKLPEFLRMLKSHKDGIKYDYKDNYFVLEQVSWSAVFNRQPKTKTPGILPIDLNNYTAMETVKAWLDHADYYDSDWMPYIQYFDSFEQLEQMINEVDLKSISKFMSLRNVSRRAQIETKWVDILHKVEDKNSRLNSSFVSESLVSGQ
jgi:hypothetical protein